MSRAILGGLMAALGIVLVASLTYAIVAWFQEGRVSLGAMVLFGITAVSFLFLQVVFRRESKPLAQRAHCFNCGRRVYLTLRSVDRRQMLTCFSCGSEWALPLVQRDTGLLRRPVPHRE